MHPKNNISHLPTSYADPAHRAVHVPYVQPERKQFVAKGHDSQLQSAQYDKSIVDVTALSGDVYSGTISRRDRYTVTLAMSGGLHDGKEIILFKHAIESVMINKSQAS
jgi:sRNA-binding regulator protein Hfq